jgi:hypothetical protein
MTATKRNFRKKSKSLRRKGGKKPRHTRSRRTARGGNPGDIVEIADPNDASLPAWVKKMMEGYRGTEYEARNYLSVDFSAIESNRVSVEAMSFTSQEDATNISTMVYSRSRDSGSLAHRIIPRNDICIITDASSGEKWMAKFVGWPSDTINGEFPTRIYFYNCVKQ